MAGRSGLHGCGHRFAPFATGIRRAQDLVPAGIELTPALPIESEVGQHAGQRIAVAHALRRFEQAQRHGRVASADERTRNTQHTGGQLPRAVHTERLTEHTLRGRDQRRRQLVDEVRKQYGVWAQGHPALVDPGLEPEAADDRVVTCRQIGEGDRAGFLAADTERSSLRFARCNGAEFHAARAFQCATADIVGVKFHADQVGYGRGGVEDGHRSLVGLACPRGPRMGEGHAEFRITHHHAGRRFARDGHGASGKAVEIRREVHLHDMQAFLQTLDEQLALPRFAGLQAIEVVGCPGFAVGSNGAHRCGIPHRAIHPGKAQRIVPGRIVASGDKVGALRQDHFGANVAHAQSAARRGRIFRVNHYAEKLVEKSDIPRNDHQRGDRRNLQLEILVPQLGLLEVQRLDLDVGHDRLQFRGQHEALGELAVDCLRLAQPFFELCRRNDFRGLLEGWRDHGELDVHAFAALEDEAHFELHRAEIVLVDVDPPLLDLGHGQRTRGNARDQNFVENLHRHRIRCALEHNRSIRIDQADAIERIVTDQIKRRQHEGLVGRTDQASRGEGRPAQISFDKSSVGNLPAHRDTHRSRDPLRHRQRRRSHRHPLTGDFQGEGGQGSCVRHNSGRHPRRQKRDASRAGHGLRGSIMRGEIPVPGVRPGGHPERSIKL